MRDEVQEMSILLEKARDLVTGERNGSYGMPSENHGRTAALWSAYLGVEVKPKDVCVLNILQKLSRERHRPTRDNLIDVAGYAANAHACVLAELP
jgi:hypothetical protein